jgi:4'-phosphopantetheinyl transferase
MSSRADLADVWVIDLHTLNSADVATCDVVLSSAERDRMRRFHYKQDQDAYRAAHALARLALSSCEAAVPPHAWTFEETLHGRPEISAQCGSPRLRFNISHTRRVVACIVTSDLDCGVDVELTHRCSDLHDLARTVLAPSEWATIAAASDTERPILFSRYWTLKEAFAKARGLGMSLAFDQIAFDLFDGSARLHAHSGEWHFEQWSPTPTHTLATAVRARGPVRLIRHCEMPHNILTKIQV